MLLYPLRNDDRWMWSQDVGHGDMMTSTVVSYPIGSMYAIYGNIYHQYTPFMLAYIPYMDPMGTVANVSFFPVFCFSLLNLCKSEHSFDMF